MYTHYNSKLDRQVTTLHPGEFFSTREDIVLATVLGSCIAVAICEMKLRFGGLNHFMLPGQLKGDRAYYLTESGKYGMFAMELLINDMMKKGGRRENMTAKVFGGGSMLDHESSFTRVSQSNIDFALEYLKLEGIPITASDVGGHQARKIYFFPLDFKVLLRRIEGRLVNKVEREEDRYRQQLRQETGRTAVDRDDVTLF
jgi:chemotaxis protein CheD